MAVYIRDEQGGLAHIGHSNADFLRDLLARPELQDEISARIFQNFGAKEKASDSPSSVPSAAGLKVFLSYAREDRIRVRRLYSRLRNDGYAPWMDDRALMPGSEWKAEIRQALQDSDAAIICFSRYSIAKNGYVNVEIREILELAATRPFGRIFLIPVRLDDCELPDRIRDTYQHADLFVRRGYEQLKEALRSVAEARTR